jgi:hypothetical protein
MKRFGPVKAPGDLEEVPTPLEGTCPHCDESITQGDSGFVIPHLDESGSHERPHHRECFLRGIFGSVGHQQGKCYCFGGTEEDPPGMTRREAARAAERHMLMHGLKDTE